MSESAAAKLARLAPSMSWLDQPRGGMPDLTPSDIAAACSGLKPDEFNWVLLKWTRTHNKNTTQFYQMYGKVMDVVQRNEWDTIRGYDLHRKMMQLALYEILNPKCLICGGSGMFRYRPCKSCNGDGNAFLSGRKRAEAIGVPQKTWQTKWAPRYDIILKLLIKETGRIELKALWKIRKKLRA